MTTLITGGTGYLGAALAHHLVLAEGVDTVVLLDRYPRPEVVEDIADHVALVRGDVLELSELVSAARKHGVDAIAHLGFAVGVPEPERIAAYVQVQCLGTTNVYETGRLLGIKRVVNASSVAVWGDRLDRCATEDDPARPRGMYGAHKLWSEHVAEHYNAVHGMEIISLRVGATLGYGRSDRLGRLEAIGLTHEQDLRPNFMASPELAAAGVPVVMPADDVIADFLYVKDAARAWWLALTAPRPEHSIFNLRAEQRPVGDMTRHLRKLLPDAPISVATERTHIPQLMDNRRIVAELGFEPAFPLERALEDYLAQMPR